MKKHLALLLALALLCAAPLALAADKVVINEEINRDEMLSITGKLIKIDKPENVVFDVELGFAFMVPTEYSGTDPEGRYYQDPTPGSVGFVYIPDSVIDLHLKMMNIDFESDDLPTEEEYEADREKILAAMVHTFAVMRVNPEKPESDVWEKYVRDLHQHAELVAENGDDKLYLCWNDNYDGTQLTDEEKAAMATYIENALSWVREGLMVFPPVGFYDHFGYDSEEIPLDGGPESFNGEDLYGKPFNAVEEFAKFDLTIVNIWSTGCNPCIEEMPALQQLKEALPGNVNLITVCLDGEEENPLAIGILESMNVDITTLKGDAMQHGVLKNVSATPTNLFISRTGMQVGPAIVGAMASLDSFVEDSMEIINERLAMPAPEE